MEKFTDYYEWIFRIEKGKVKTDKNESLKLENRILLLHESWHEVAREIENMFDEVLFRSCIVDVD